VKSLFYSAVPAPDCAPVVGLCTLVFFDFLKFGVNDIALFRIICLGLGTVHICTGTLSLLRGVHLLRNPAGGLRQLRGRCFHRRGIIALDRLVYLGNRCLDSRPLVVSRVLTRLLERFARGVHHTICGITRGDRLLKLLVCLGIASAS